MAQESYRLRENGRNQDVVRRLRDEIYKLESQLARLPVEAAPHRFSLLKTYKSMIESRKELLSQMES